MNQPDNLQQKSRVLFICTANAARSQMAEGYLRARYVERFDVFSAGTRRSSVSTQAIAVMKEIGIDISAHRSKSIADLSGLQFDVVITLCDNAHKTCPVIPGVRKSVHRPFTDPYEIGGTGPGNLDRYRKTRDEIIAWIDTAFATGMFA